MRTPNKPRQEQRAAMNIPRIAFLTAVLTGARLHAQVTCTRYDASLGTSPDQQGWELDDGPTGGGNYSVSDNVLFQSSLPFTSTACTSSTNPQRLNWFLDDEVFDFDKGLTFAAELRIVASQYLTHRCDDHPAAGFRIAVRDHLSRNFQIGFGESMIYLLNDWSLPFGDPGVVEMAFDTTDDFHEYRLEVNASGGELFIDGIAQLSLPHGAPLSTPNDVSVGDSTFWSNSAAEVRSLVFLHALPSSPLQNLGNPLAGFPRNPMLRSRWNHESRGPRELHSRKREPELPGIVGLGTEPGRCAATRWGSPRAESRSGGPGEHRAKRVDRALPLPPANAFERPHSLLAVARR